MRNKKRAFTLIEMLIVIVIIGILASALIPRLSNAKVRATDAAIKAEMRQIATSLAAHATSMSSNGTYVGIPDGLITATTFGPLISGGSMNSIPRTTNYYFRKVTKGGIPNAGFVLTGEVSTLAVANWADGYSGQTSLEAEAASWAACGTLLLSWGNGDLYSGANNCYVSKDLQTLEYMLAD